MLFAEGDIRRAVKEARQEISFYPDGRFGDGIKTDHADATANIVLKRAKKIKSVYVEGAGTVFSPEKWLSCFDAVREKARQCERPEIIYNEWAARYEAGAEYIGEIITGELDFGLAPDCYIMWIIYHVEAEAVKRGLMAEAQCSLYMPDKEGVYKAKTIKTGKPRKDL